MPPVLRSKPSLEVHRPYLVAPAGRRQLSQPPLRSSAGTPSCPPAELHPFEPLAERAGRRDTLPFAFYDQSSSQLATSPTPMAPSQSPNSLHPLLAYSPRRASWSTFPIQQSSSTFLFEAMDPFVAAFAADSKQPTQPRHALLGLKHQLHKLQPSRHLSQNIPCHGPQMAGK